MAVQRRMALMVPFLLAAAESAGAAPVPLSEALGSVSAQTGARFLLADGVDAETRVALQDEKSTAGDALTKLLEPVGLAARRVASSRTYIIMPEVRRRLERPRRKMLDSDKALDVRLRLRVGHVPFRNFLDMISAETKTEFTLEAGKDRRRVSLDLEEASARDALEAALDLKGLEIRRSGAGGYLIRAPGQ